MMQGKPKSIFYFLRPYKYKFILLAVLYAFSTFCSILLPKLMSEIVDKGIKQSDIKYIETTSIKMAVVAVVAVLSSVISNVLNAKIYNRFLSDARAGIFDKINSLTFEEFSRIGTSSLLTRATEDILTLSNMGEMMVYTLISVPVFVIGGIVMAFTTDYLLALIMLCFIPPVALVCYLVTRKIGYLWEQSDKYCDEQNKVVAERLSGIRVIRAFDTEDTEHERIKKATDKMAENIINANVRTGLINPVAMFALNLATVVVLYFGASRIGTGVSTTAGGIIAVVEYIALMMNGLISLFWAIAMLPSIGVAIKRTGEVFKMQGTVDTEGMVSEKLSGALTIENLSFSYPNSKKQVLTDINLKVNDGEIVSVIGGTGSGKSTLIKLLLGFYSAKSGNIFLGGKNYNDVSVKTIRDNYSVALQKSMIFEGSVKENVLMSVETATDDDVKKVLEVAEMGDFITEKDGGIEYILKESGANISGGQKQRINIARTILKDASVYIFDDSFSALDFLTESKLRKKLNKYIDGKTQIIVTQRIASAMRSDKIYVFDGGKVVGEGTHAELLENCDVYKEIYYSQIGRSEDILSRKSHDEKGGENE